MNRIVCLRVEEGERFFLNLSGIRIAVRSAHSVQRVQGRARRLIRVRPTRTSNSVLRNVLILVIKVSARARVTHYYLRRRVNECASIVARRRVIKVVNCRLLVARCQVNVCRERFRAVELRRNDRSRVRARLVKYVVRTDLSVKAVLLGLTVCRDARRVLQVVAIILGANEVTGNVSLHVSRNASNVRLRTAHCRKISIRVSFRSHREQDVRLRLRQLRVMTRVFSRSKGRIVLAYEGMSVSTERAITGRRLVSTAILRLLPWFLLRANGSIRRFLMTSVHVRIRARVSALDCNVNNVSVNRSVCLRAC